MKKNSKKLLSVFLSVLMVLSVLPMSFSAVFAEDEPAYATGYAGLGDYVAPALGEGEEGEGGGSSVSIPADFSLVDSMPAARDQNPYGSCWAFGTIAAVESNIITQGFVEDPDDIDLSEMQLIYYMYHPTVDPLGNITEGEGSYQSDGELIDGGRSDYAMNVLSHWNGIASETADGKFVYGVYGSNVGALEGDWDDSLATDYNDYIIKGYYAINNQKNADELKAAIMENGAATISYFHDGKYINSNYAFFSGSNHKNSSNHAVSIVGWDDNYSKENFGKEANDYLRPENDGAWLIRNSWGDDWGLDGYFWLSYEDQSIEDTSFIAIMQKAGAYDNNYFFDGGAMYYPSAKVHGAVNKFTAKGDEVLKAVSVVFPEDTEVNYTVDIYLNPEDNNFVKNETPVQTTTGTTTFAGMYTIELDSAVALSEGDVFAVAITADEPVVISYDKYSVHENRWFVNNVTWEEDSSYLINGYGTLSSMEDRGVARIKAYTDVVDEDTVTITAEDMNICEGNTEALSVTASPDGAEIAYTVSDTSVATVSGGAVTGVAEGSTRVVAYNAADNVKATFTVTVSAHDLQNHEAAAATCTEGGSGAYAECLNCGKVFIGGAEATAEQIAALATEATGHKPAEGSKVEAVEATAYTDGNIEYYVCEYCGEYIVYDAEHTVDEENPVYAVVSEDDIAVAATYVLAKVYARAASCTKEGNIEYYVVLNQDGTQATYTAVDDETGETEEIELYVVYNGDTSQYDVIAFEDTVIPAGHDLVKTEAAEASCIDGAIGNIEYYQCSACSNYFIAVEGEAEEGEEPEITYTQIAYSQTRIYPVHTMTKTAAKAATCTEEGNVQYYTCSVCGRYYKYQSGSTELSADELVIPAKGHSPRAIPMKEATCTVDGYEAYYVCTDCDKLFSDEACENELASPVAIEATGHDNVVNEVIAATCTEPGAITYTCNICGETTIEIIPALGHNIEDGTCTQCGLSEEAINSHEIAELGGEICEYCGKRHGTSWFSKILYAVHGILKFFSDLFDRFG